MIVSINRKNIEECLNNIYKVRTQYEIFKNLNDIAIEIGK